MQLIENVPHESYISEGEAQFYKILVDENASSVTFRINTRLDYLVSRDTLCFADDC